MSSDEPTSPDETDGFDHDVVIVGGGLSGASAAVFTARDGLDTVVFDRGNAALRRAAFVENYLGFPAGIDIDSLYDRMHAHVEEAGADYVADMVTEITRPEGETVDVDVDAEADGSPAELVDDQPGFVVETQEGRTVTTRFVIAAAWYDGDYLRPLVGDDAFEVHDHGDGNEHEHFDSDYPDHDGRTPVDGLYVAAPNGPHNAQAIIAAGHGAQVARSLIKDIRLAEGYPEELAEPYDWLRRRAELEGEWLERDRWREWFDDRVPDDHDLDDDHLQDLRERYLDRAFDTIRTRDEVDDLTQHAHARLLDYLDDDRILDELDNDQILDHIADDRILERAREIESSAERDPPEVDR